MLLLLLTRIREERLCPDHHEGAEGSQRELFPQPGPSRHVDVHNVPQALYNIYIYICMCVKNTRMIVSTQRQQTRVYLV